MNTSMVNGQISHSNHSGMHIVAVDLMQTAMEDILRAELNQQKSREARSEMRHPFPKLIQLTPLGGDGQALPESATTVVGSNLSLKGINFFCKEPFPFRRVIASLPLPNGDELHVLVDLKWCRFVGGGWFDNGGQFIGLAQKNDEGFLVPSKKKV